MDAYIYNADINCEECASQIRVELGETDEGDYSNSDTYPQGPYNDGGGEADCPQHCGSCQLFLENPLTSDGANYVREACEEHLNPITRDWADYYDYLEITI